MEGRKISLLVVGLMIGVVALPAVAEHVGFDGAPVGSASAGKCLSESPRWDDVQQPDGKQCVLWIPWDRAPSPQ